MDRSPAAEEHELERPSKSYPKRRLLPHLEEEALKPHSPVYNAADRPLHGQARKAFQPKVQPAPHRHSVKDTKAWGNTEDLRDILDSKAKLQDQYTGKGHARQHGTMIVASDTLKVNPVGMTTADKTHMNCVGI